MVDFRIESYGTAEMMRAKTNMPLHLGARIVKSSRIRLNATMPMSRYLHQAMSLLRHHRYQEQKRGDGSDMIHIHTSEAVERRQTLFLCSVNCESDLESNLPSFRHLAASRIQLCGLINSMSASTWYSPARKLCLRPRITPTTLESTTTTSTTGTP